MKPYETVNKTVITTRVVKVLGQVMLPPYDSHQDSLNSCIDGSNFIGYSYIKHRCSVSR